MARLGHTEFLDNPTISEFRPDWARAAKVIADAYGPVDTPTDQDRAVITRVVLGVQKKLKDAGVSNVTPADIQAILWYPEKDLWEKLTDGKITRQLNLSYDSEFLKIAEELGLGDAAKAAVDRYESSRTARADVPTEQRPDQEANSTLNPSKAK